MSWDLRHGRYQDVLADVEVDCVITDPPYSERTHSGHDHAVRALRTKKGWPRKGQSADTWNKGRSTISYARWTEGDVAEFMDFWAPRNRGWFVVLSDNEFCSVWREAFEQHNLTGFQPVPCVLRGMTVRLGGDGPSSWAIYTNVARPKRLCRWGTLPGAYTGNAGTVDGKHPVVGGKPVWLMRELVKDYSRPGDLVCDPCAGAGTTLLAAQMEGREAIGAERDPETYEKARRRLSGLSAVPDPHQAELF